MPHPEIEKLEKNSSKEQINAARSACIAREIKNGKEKDQAAAMCYSMVRDKTGGGE
jgi:hypothetical protein